MLLGVSLSLDTIVVNFYKICMAIDMVIYKLIGSMFGIFTLLSDLRIFSSDVIGSFTRRVYLIISIVMLFLMAYSFLMVVINPENVTKGNTSVAKIVRNTIISLTVLVLTPTIFEFAYGFQHSVVKSNVIGRIIIGSNTAVDLSNASGQFSTIVFESSYYIKNPHIEGQEISEAETAYYAAESVAMASNDVTAFSDTIDYVQTGDIEYNFFICAVIGIIVLYLLVTFVFDVALRAVKLAFLQIIAPVPILLYIVPGKDKSMGTWVKESLKTFFELFIRIAILYFGVYIISIVLSTVKEGSILGFISNQGILVRNICKLFIILGVLMFIKQAPQLICDILGIKSEPGLLSLKKRLKDSGLGAFTGGVLGGAAGATLGVIGAKKYAKARGASKKEQAFGMVSGAFHGTRLGAQAGAAGNIQGIGDGYNYAAANQKAWAHMTGDHKFGNWLSVQGEMLRDNFGIPSYYDDLVGMKETETNAAVARYNKSIQDLQAKNKAKEKELDDQYGFTNKANANKMASDAGTDVKSTAKSEVSKKDYLETARITTVKKDQYGNMVEYQDNVSSSQMEGLESFYNDLLSDQQISNDQHRKLVAELGRGQDKIEKDYVSAQIVSSNRDKNVFAGMNDTQKLSTRFATDYIDGYVESAKKMVEWTDMEELEKDFTAQGDTQSLANVRAMMRSWEADRKAEAEKQFLKIISNPDDYKTNQKMINSINKYQDIVNMTGDSEVGLEYDVSTGQFIQNAKVAKIKTSLSGNTMYDSIKFVGIADSTLSNFKDELYRDSANSITYIKPDGRTETVLLNQAINIYDNLSKEVKKVQDELKDFKLAYADEEQISKMAKDTKKYRGFRHPKGK